MNFTDTIQENIIFLIAGIFVISLLTQLFYYFFVYARLIYSRKKTVRPTEQFPVSVVICAKDEEENLGKFLPLILEQDYPHYEVIVVNDCSKDNSENILDELKQKYKHLRSTLIKEDEKFSHGKKLALTIGIKAASYEYLILTDADCEPASKNWLKEIQKNFSNEKNLVLGYGGYFAEKGLLNNIIRYETVFTAMQYLGFALAGKPYMGVGRNLAYKRELFFKNKGFANHLHLLSGDDDLFVQQVASSINTAVEFSPEAHTRSIPKRDFKSWFFQKRRHLTTGLHYRGRFKFLLSLEIFTRYALVASFTFLLLKDFYPPYLISLFVLRYLVFLIVFKLVMKRLNEKNLILPSLLYDIFLPISNFAAIIINFALSKKNKWK